MSSELISITRPLLPFDHNKLREHIPRTNRLGELSIKWRRLGEAGITLLERGEYQKAAEGPYSRLTHISAVLAKASLEETVAAMEGGLERITVPVTNVDYMDSDNSPYVSIAYILDAKQVDHERQLTTNAIDKLSGTKPRWPTFESHVSIATIPRTNADPTILDEFWDFAPLELTFTGIDVAAT